MTLGSKEHTYGNEKEKSVFIESINVFPIYIGFVETKKTHAFPLFTESPETSTMYLAPKKILIDSRT